MSHAYNQNAYDVIVVGGGIVGASAAYHLAHDGAKTLLIDRHDVGRATDAGAGILAPEMNRRDPEAWFNFAVEAVGYYPELAAALAEEDAGETSYARCGMLLVAASPDEQAAYADAERHILARCDPHISELSLHIFKPDDLGLQVIIKNIRQTYVTHAVFIEQRVISQQIPDRGDIFAAKCLVVFGQRGAYA